MNKDGIVSGRCREKDCRYEVAAEDEVKGFPLLALIWVGGSMRAHRREAHGWPN